MKYRVRGRWWQDAPGQMLALCALVCWMALAPRLQPPTPLVTAATEWQSNRWLSETVAWNTLFQLPSDLLCERRPLAPERHLQLDQDVRTAWDGTRYVVPTFYEPGRNTMPSSPFGSMIFSPLTGKNAWEPWPVESLGVYAWGQIRPVASGTLTALQAAVNSAQDFDIVEFQVPVSYSTVDGLIWPNRGTSGTVLIRDAATWGNLPSQGTRVTAAHFAGANTLTLTGFTSHHIYANGSRGWRCRGLKVVVAYPTGANPDNSGAWTCRAINQSHANLPRYLTWEQCYGFNNWQAGPPTGLNFCRKFLTLNAEYCRVVDSLVEGMAGNGTESQAVNADRGEGRLMIRNNALEGLSETIMWGGTALNYTTTYVAGHLHNLWISRNFLYRRSAWMQPTAGFVYTNQKNFMEHKNGRFVVWDSNRCLGMSGQGQQNDVNVKHSPQSAAEAGANGLVSTHDIWIYGNSFEDSFAGPTATYSTSGFRSYPGTRNVEYSHNLWFRNRSIGNAASRWLFADISTNNNIPNVYLHHNTGVATNSWLVMSGNGTTIPNALPNFRCADNVIYTPFQYAAPRCSGPTGLALLNSASGATWQFAGNVLQIGASQTLTGQLGGTGNAPPGNFGTAPGGTIQFRNPASGDYTLIDPAFQTVSTTGGRPGVDYALLTALLAGV